MSKTFHLISLGCPRNIVDSEIMIGHLIKHGLKAAPDVTKADFIVINTCGFLNASRQESIDTIANAIASKKKTAKIIVTGCLLQVKTPEFEALLPQIHYLLGAGDLPSILQAVEASKPGVVSSAKSYLETGNVPRTLSTPPHYAYLKIAEGCAKRCSYCIIPHIKGPLQSKPEEQILAEMSSLLEKGVYEIILIAQDLGDWGKDFGFSGSSGLPHILKKILCLKKDFRLRLLYLYPDEITDQLIEVMKSDARILPYLDMPIQHINDDILRGMRRSTSKEHIIKTITTLRKEIPTIAIRTSLIVGFPGETDDQFLELCSFIKSTSLDHVGIFSYSNEPLSHSATLPNQIPDDIKEKRCQMLSAIQHSIVKKRNKKLIGKKLSVLVDGYHPETKLLMTGRTAGQCPDVDSQILIQNPGNVTSFGTPYLVAITGTSEYDLVGEVLKPINQEEWS